MPGDALATELLGTLRDVTRARIAGADGLGDVDDAGLRPLRSRLAEIDDAIARVEGGVYGRCLSCGRAIDGGDLAGDPVLNRCRTCRATHLG